MEEPEVKKTSSKKEEPEDKGTKFVRGYSYWDEKEDKPLCKLKLSVKARKLLEEFCVKGGKALYQAGTNRPRQRYLVKRILSNSFDLSSVFGHFFDVEYIEKKVMERTTYFENYDQCESYAEKVKEFFEVLVRSAVQLKKVNVFTIYVKTENRKKRGGTVCEKKVIGN